MRPFRHALLQMVLLLITINVFWDTPDEFIFTADRFMAWLFFYVMMNMIVYINIYLLVPRLLLRDHIFFYLAGVAVLIVLVIFGIGALQSLFIANSPDPDDRGTIPVWLNLLSTLVSVGMLVLGTSAVQLFRKWMSDSLKAGELESATLQTELGFLKSQINPHFLFNMLNNSYLLIKKRRPEASEVIFKLEDMLRYQINDSTKDEVPLSSDIRFLNDFLNLEKVRRDRFSFSISKEGDIDDVMLSPLLFIPFVENAVKHNSDSDNMSYVNLLFRVTGGRLEFRCVNSVPQVAAVKSDVGGIGLKNIKRRLELLYPDRHSLEISETDKTYCVDLILDL